MSEQQTSAQDRDADDWDIEWFRCVQDLRDSKMAWAHITPMIAKMSPDMKPERIQPEYYRLKKRLIKEKKLDPETLFPPAPRKPATLGQPTVANRPALRQAAAARQPAAASTRALYASAMGRAGGEQQAMQQMFDAIVAERDSLLEEVDELWEELQRLQDEHEEEWERNLCERFEESGNCNLRRCRKMHRWGDRQVRFEDGLEE